MSDLVSDLTTFRLLLTGLDDGLDARYTDVETSMDALSERREPE